MKTIATMALLLGTIAVGIAPAAEAREGRTNRHDTQKKMEWDGVKHSSPHARHLTPHARHLTPHARQVTMHKRQVKLHASQVKQVRRLAFQLERATDELRHDARNAARRVDRYEMRALRAIYRLETAADHFSRRVQRRGPQAVRELRHELRTVEAAFRNARSRAGAFHRTGELRRDFRRVNHLMVELDETLEPRRRVAGWGRHHRWNLAQR